MYDSGRWFRALVMGVTLLAVMWAIQHLIAHKHASAATATTSRGQVSTSAAELPLGHPIDVANIQLPFVAFDNTCLTGEPEDLSGCTRFLSGGAAHSYLLRLDHSMSLSIEVFPQNEIYDVGFALYGSNRSCVIGSDEQPQGMAERVVSAELPAGEYELVVGGYSEDCGPYRLTVSEPQGLVARLVHTATATGRNGRALRWETFGETGLNHFVVYHCNGETREQVAVIRSRGGPARMAQYRCLDRSGKPGGDYELVAVSRDGRTQSFFLPEG